MWPLSLNIFRRHLKTHFLRIIDETFLAHYRFLYEHVLYKFTLYLLGQTRSSPSHPSASSLISQSHLGYC